LRAGDEALCTSKELLAYLKMNQAKVYDELMDDGTFGGSAASTLAGAAAPALLVPGAGWMLGGAMGLAGGYAGNKLYRMGRGIDEELVSRILGNINVAALNAGSPEEFEDALQHLNDRLAKGDDLIEQPQRGQTASRSVYTGDNEIVGHGLPPQARGPMRQPDFDLAV